MLAHVRVAVGNVWPWCVALYEPSCFVGLPLFPSLSHLSLSLYLSLAVTDLQDQTTSPERGFKDAVVSEAANSVEADGKLPTDDKDIDAMTPDKKTEDAIPEEKQQAVLIENGTNEEPVEEMWDLVKVISQEQLTKSGTILCATEGCMLAAACAWTSNLTPKERWFTCLDCQERDFEGWPEPKELPFTKLTAKHVAIMSKKCSKSRSPAMPKVDIVKEPAPSTQPSTGTAAANTTATTGNTTPKKAGTSRPASVTPTPAKPSASALAMHRKWQEAAQAMGGPEARIVVSKPAAKKLIFDALYDAFCPMNITQIHRVRLLFRCCCCCCCCCYCHVNIWF